MQLFKLILVTIVCLAVIGSAHAKNTTPRGYMNSAANSLGNNSDLTTKSGRQKWSKGARSDTKNFASDEFKKNRKEPRWKKNQRARNQKKSNATSGVNE